MGVYLPNDPTQYVSNNTLWTATPLTTTAFTYPYQFYGVGQVPSGASLTIAGFQDPFPQSPLPRAKREQPVVGYRAWKVGEERKLGRPPKLALKSTGVEYTWQRGRNHASCSPYTTTTSSPHAVPSEHCHCGFWVMATLDKLQEHFKVQAGAHVVGAVMGWGTVIQHGETGWRAEHAQIIALLDLKLGRKDDRLTKAVADTYGLPIFERDALELVVSEHDGKLPPEAPGA